MQVTTIEEARQLVGRTFERDGKRRTVVKADSMTGKPTVWFRGGGEEWEEWAVWDFALSFNDWLAGANEVTE